MCFRIYGIELGSQGRIEGSVCSNKRLGFRVLRVRVLTWLTKPTVRTAAVWHAIVFSRRLDSRSASCSHTSTCIVFSREGG